MNRQAACPTVISMDPDDTDLSDDEQWSVVCRNPRTIPNEVHAQQLKFIEHQLNRLCAHFNVIQLPALIPVSQVLLLDEAAGGRCDDGGEADTTQPPEPQRDNSVAWEEESKEINGRFMEYIRFARLSQQRAPKQDPAVKILSQETVHSPLIMAEIKTTLVNINIFQAAASVGTVCDQHGITWGITFFLNGEVLILELGTLLCPQILGSFRLMLRFMHASPLKSFPKSFQVSIRSMQTSYPVALASVSQLIQDGYMTKDGAASIRIAIVPTDSDADRSCSLWLERRKEPTGPQNAPRYCEERFSLTNYTITHTRISPKLFDLKRNAWQLIVSMNRGVDSTNREFISILVRRYGASPYVESCHEYFIELLCQAEGADGKRGTGYRYTGRVMNGTELIPKFILKSQLGEYLKDNTLRFYWGIREVPIR